MLPYLLIIGFCVSQFVRPTLLGWFALTAAFGSYTAGIAAHLPHHKSVLALLLAALPTAFLVLEVNRSQSIKIKLNRLHTWNGVLRKLNVAQVRREPFCIESQGVRRLRADAKFGHDDQHVLHGLTSFDLHASAVIPLQFFWRKEHRKRRISDPHEWYPQNPIWKDTDQAKKNSGPKTPSSYLLGSDL